MKNKLLLFTSLLSLTALVASCSEIPPQAYYTHGKPESLIVSSTRESGFDIQGKASVKRIMKWVAKSHPADAALSCREASKACNKLEHMLRERGIATTRIMAETDSVSFSHKHVAVRDCKNGYIDNPINPYNLNHPVFGCSVAANSAQQITDRRTLIDPPLMDLDDAQKGVQVVGEYQKAPIASTDFSPLSTSQSLATSSGGGR